VWKNYNYQDYQGQQYQALVKQYVDPRVEMVARLHREDEMVQAAHRIRGVNHQDRQILIISQLPIEELRPTLLTTLKDYTKMTGQAEDLIESACDYLLQEDGYFNLNHLKALLSGTLVNSAIKNTLYSTSDQRQSGSGFPSDSSLQRQMKRFARLRELKKSLVTVEIRGKDQGGGGTWSYVYHEEPLSTEQVERIQVEYKQQVLEQQPEVKAEQVWVRMELEAIEVESLVSPTSEVGWEVDIGSG